MSRTEFTNYSFGGVFHGIVRNLRVWNCERDEGGPTAAIKGLAMADSHVPPPRAPGLARFGKASRKASASVRMAAAGKRLRARHMARRPMAQY